jgi:hypothetical protein
MLALTAEAAGNSAAFEKALGANVGRANARQARPADTAIIDVLYADRRQEMCQYYERYYVDGPAGGGPTQYLQVCYSFWGSLRAGLLATGQFLALETELLTGDAPWKIANQRTSWLERPREKSLYCVVKIAVPAGENLRAPAAVDRLTIGELVIRMECRGSSAGASFGLTSFEKTDPQNGLSLFIRAIRPAIEKVFRAEYQTFKK